MTSFSHQRVAIVLPAYNEEQTVAATMAGFHAQLPTADIIVINNNSKDDTRAVAESTLLELGARGRVLDEPRAGKGNAVRRAFLEVEADIYILADADQTYPPERVHDLMRPILENRADMVVGDRHSDGHYARENSRALHGFGNRLVQALVNWLFRSQLVDIMSGYRAFNKLFVKNYPILVEGFQIETDMTLHALHKRFRIVEIAVEYRDRPAGSVSKLNTFSDGARVLFTIAQILRYYRPLAFFGTLSALFVFAGLVCALPVFDDWIRHQYIYHVPLAILASALEIVAIMLLGIGLMLDSIVHQQCMEYERHLANNYSRFGTGVAGSSKDDS